MKRALLRVCTCGAEGYIIIEDTRIEGSASPKIVALRGPLRLDDGAVSCSKCGKGVAAEDV